MLKEDMFDYYKNSIQKSKGYKRMAMAALKHALQRLDTVVTALLDICAQPVPPDKIPEFQIFDGVIWPYRQGGNYVDWRRIQFAAEGNVTYLDYAAEKLFNLHNMEPERLVHALKTIEAAEAWCYERMRYPMQVLDQNPELKEFIEARAVAAALEQGSR